MKLKQEFRLIDERFSKCPICGRSPIVMKKVRKYSDKLFFIKIYCNGDFPKVHRIFDVEYCGDIDLDNFKSLYEQTRSAWNRKCETVNRLKEFMEEEW